MKQGIPGFIPDRLVEAREARDLSQVSLAQLMGRSSSASISRWEKGEQAPEAVALQEIAQALNLPTAYFLRPTPSHGGAPLFYRSMAAATKAARSKARARLRWAQDISLALQEYVDLPTCNLPIGINSRDFMAIHDEEIEAIATECRRHWGLGDGPISDLHLLLENNGIITIHDEIEAATMDGLSSWSQADSRAYIYVAIDKPSAVRARFNAAHELAHIILHRNIDQSTLQKAEEFKEIERQANLFASAFLLPAITFAGELSAPTLSGLLALKERWKVSIGAMIKRCETLGILEGEYATRVWKHYSTRGWRKEEPFDDRIIFEKPKLLARSIKLLAEEGGWSLQQLLDGMPYSAGDIERLTSLPPGYLFGSAEKLAFTPRLKAASVQPVDATVLQFPGRNRAIQ